MCKININITRPFLFFKSFHVSMNNNSYESYVLFSSKYTVLSFFLKKPNFILNFKKLATVYS